MKVCASIFIALIFLPIFACGDILSDYSASASQIDAEKELMADNTKSTLAEVTAALMKLSIKDLKRKLLQQKLDPSCDLICLFYSPSHYRFHLYKRL